MERLKQPEEHGVVLILSATDWQKKMICSELIRMDPGLAPRVDDADQASSSIVEADRAELPHEVTNETLSQNRIELYATKACLFITTRILVRDFV